jgi:hypothetical protein
MNPCEDIHQAEMGIIRAWSVFLKEKRSLLYSCDRCLAFVAMLSILKPSLRPSSPPSVSECMILSTLAPFFLHAPHGFVQSFIQGG